MLVCIQKSTGRVLEMQSFAKPGTLIANLKSAGVDPADLEERSVDDAGYAALIAAQPKTRDESVRAIESTRDAALATGAVTWNARRWHTDKVFQDQLCALVSAFANGILPALATVTVRTVDNENVQLGFADLKALAGVVLPAVQKAWSDSWAAKDALPL